MWRAYRTNKDLIFCINVNVTVGNTIFFHITMHTHKEREREGYICICGGRDRIQEFA